MSNRSALYTVLPTMVDMCIVRNDHGLWLCLANDASLGSLDESRETIVARFQLLKQDVQLIEDQGTWKIG